MTLCQRIIILIAVSLSCIVLYVDCQLECGSEEAQREAEKCLLCPTGLENECCWIWFCMQPIEHNPMCADQFDRYIVEIQRCGLDRATCYPGWNQEGVQISVNGPWCTFQKYWHVPTDGQYRFRNMTKSLKRRDEDC